MTGIPCRVLPGGEWPGAVVPFGRAHGVAEHRGGLFWSARLAWAEPHRATLDVLIPDGHAAIAADVGGEVAFRIGPMLVARLEVLAK